MSVVILCAVLLGAVLLALGLSRLMLGAVLNAMAGHRPPGVKIQWRRVAFVAGLFWLWYLVPALAAAANRSPAASLLRHLLGD